MRRIVVIGSGGSGKSTFSRSLGRKLGIPVVHLDRLYWQADWKKRPADEWLELLRAELEKEQWVIDGNFGATRKMRMARADTIVFLDLPRYLCIYRILKRTLFYRNGKRPDMADGCHERFDAEFIAWVWNFKNDGRKRLVAEIEALDNKEIVILKSRAQVERFITEAA